MNSIFFEYEQTCLVQKTLLESLGQQLLPEIRNCSAVSGYGSPYASLALPSDASMVQRVKEIVREKKMLEPSVLVVIGIGGSNLGTQAVQEALLGKLYNQHLPFLKIYYADTVDSDYINDIALLVEQEFQKQHNVLVNVVSKSGATTETIANFEIFLLLLRKYYGEAAHEYIVVTTDKGSALWDLAQEERYVCLEIPKNVGGRYSVFSPVGLFPLGMLDVDIDQLLAGARLMLTACTHEDIFNNPAALSAAIILSNYSAGFTIHDTFLFSVDLEGVGKWYRQLMGESIGKEMTKSGERREVGITPTVSIGSTDLHSVAQLYLGGPRDKCTTFIRVANNTSNCVVPEFERFDSLVPKIQGKPLAIIMDAIINGTQAAYKARQNPFMTVVLPEKTAFYLGQLMQFKMCEMIYLGFLLDVNPFDQPNVEAYKNETRKILADE